jgi:hypothetical protein
MSVRRYEIVSYTNCKSMQTIRNQISSWFEPFQNPPSKGPVPKGAVQSAKQSITTFYSWWNSIPGEFPKSADIVSIVNKWTPYTSSKTPYILPTFASLDDGTFQIIDMEFSNAYIFSLVDTYQALVRRHGGIKPQTFPKDVKSDRLLAAKGDATIRSFYINSYYPSLYKAIHAQVTNTLKVINLVVSKSAEEEVADRLLPKRKETPPMGSPLQDILSLSALYKDTISRGKQYLPGGEKYIAVEQEYRITLQSRVDKFLTFLYENVLRDTDTPVAKAGIPIPVELAKLPTSLPLSSKSLLELIQLESTYFGEKGLESKANVLLAKATLENRRDTVESLLRTFHQSYVDLRKYCKGFPKEVEDAYTLLPTYWKERRQKAFDELPLGAAEDRTKLSRTLYGIEGQFLLAFQKTVESGLSCFSKLTHEKAGLQRPWNPHPSVLARMNDPFQMPKRIDVDALVEIRDSMVQLWMYADQAARFQFDQQFATYSDLLDLGHVIGATKELKRQMPEKPLYDLQTQYDELDRVGTKVLEELKQWYSAKLQEYGKLHGRYKTFQEQPEIQALRKGSPLEKNTVEEDLGIVHALTFYTADLARQLQKLGLQYTAEPAGKLARLRTFIQGELLEFVAAFKAQWDSYGAKPYSTYDSDRKTLTSAGIQTSTLETLMDRYTRYVGKTQNLEGLQEFTASLRELQEKHELFGKLKNNPWIGQAKVQDVVDAYDADGEEIKSTKSTAVLSKLLGKYTKAIQTVWEFLKSYIPASILNPYTMLLVEYQIFQNMTGIQRESTESLEKERILLQSFVEPNDAFVTWLSRFSEKVEILFPQLQALSIEELQKFSRTLPVPPTLYTSTPFEIRDSIHDILVTLASQKPTETKSRTFQIISAFLRTQESPPTDVSTVLSQIQSTDDISFVLVQEAKYRRGLLEVEATKDVRTLLETLETKTLQEAYKEFQEATGVSPLPILSRSEFEKQMRMYMLDFRNRYTASTSRTRDSLLSYTDEEFQKDQVSKELIQLSKKYASYAKLLKVAEQQEYTLQTIEMFKDRLYTPNLVIVQDVPLKFMKLAFDADGAQWKAKATEGDLTDLQKTYMDATKEWLSVIRSVLDKDLKTFVALYQAYSVFDQKYSVFYDLEPIPTSLQIHVEKDLALVVDMLEYSPRVEMGLNQIRERYYYFPETSQFPTLVRFIKSQFQMYLDKYIREYDSLETVLQPPKLSLADLRVRILPAMYRSTEDLQDLLELVVQLQNATDQVRAAKAIHVKKESIRTLLDSLEALFVHIQDEIPTLNTTKLDINIPQMRMDIQYAERKDEVDGKFALLANAFTMLATDVLRTFNTTYNKNLGLRSYFIKEAVEVFNAFSIHFTEDAENVPKNTPEENDALTRQYVGYIRIIQDAQPAAAVVQDTTEKYRRETIERIQEVQGVSELLESILPQPERDISGAIGLVETAYYVHEMEPTRKAYDQIYKSQQASVRESVSQAIRTWRTAYESLGPFTKWLPASQQVLAERKEIPPDSIDVAVNMGRKYMRYKKDLEKFTEPNGTFYSKVRLELQGMVDEYLENAKAVVDISGVLPPLNLDEHIQRKKAIQTASLGDLQKFHAIYTAEEKTLLENVSKFAIRILHDQFLLNNKTLEIPDYATPRERAHNLIPMLEARSIPVKSVVTELVLYGSLLKRLNTALQAQEVLRLLDAIESDIDEIELRAPTAVVDIPTQDQLDVERTRIRTATPLELEKIKVAYTSYRARIQSQFNDWVNKIVQNFSVLYTEVVKDGTLTEMGGEFVRAYTQLPTVQAELQTGATIERRTQIRNEYVGILEKAQTVRKNILSRQEVEKQSQWRDNQTKRLETSAVMQRFLYTYQAYSIDWPKNLRNTIRETTVDIERVKQSTSKEELQGLSEKYTQLLHQVWSLVEEEETKQTEATALLVRRFKSLYIPYSAGTLPSYLRIDIRMIDRDLETLSKFPDRAIVNALQTQYTGYMSALTKYMTDVGVSVGERLRGKKQAVKKLIQELNDMFLANTAVFEEFPVEVQRKIRAIPGDLHYLENPTLLSEEIDTMSVEYRKTLQQLRITLKELESESENATLLPSLEQLKGVFQEHYQTVDSSRIPPQEMPFFQGLVRGLENPVAEEQAAQAIAAYTAGLRKLAALPKTEERRIENQPFDSLQEAIGFFQKEYGIRNVSKFIPADRLLLSGLRNDAASYISLYRSPPPNMRNYAEIVEQVAKQYWDGLRILRTYPLI